MALIEVRCYKRTNAMTQFLVKLVIIFKNTAQQGRWKNVLLTCLKYFIDVLRTKTT